MDEVQHRRRRTRSARGTVPPAAETHPEEPKASGVTPAHIADRTNAPISVPPVVNSGAPVSASPPAPTAQSIAPERPTSERSSRGGRGSQEHGHLPFDAHTAHPVHDEREGERGLRGLVGSGATQVSVAAAMRARDAARPTEADMAAVEANLTIVHRGWVPRDPV